MQSQTNIVSFDAARRRAAADRRIASSGGSSASSRTGAHGAVLGQVSRRGGSSLGSTGTVGRTGAMGVHVVSARTAAGRFADEAGAGGRLSREDIFLDENWGADQREEAEEAYEEEPKGLLGRARAKRKARAKERAGRAYYRQYEAGKAADAAAAAAQAGPRAAVYKGEMGASHRRSSRMQQTTSGSVSSARAVRSGLYGGEPSEKRSGMRTSLRVLIGIGAAVLFTAVMLYGPAQQYYSDMRERDRLAAEYEAVVERNEAIGKQVEALQTDDGIMDMARIELGWVKEGEHSVSVAGLSMPRATDFRGNIVSEDIPFPHTWYSDILDPLFGVTSPKAADDVEVPEEGAAE